MELLYSLVSGLSLEQTLVFCGWVLSLLVQKIAGVVSSLLWRWFVESVSSELQASASVSEEELWHLVHGDEAGESRGSIAKVEGGLIPTLPGAIVEERIWPLWAESPLLLLRLRTVNQSWKTFIETSLEWHALNLVFYDFPGLRKYASGGRSLIAMTRRLKIEVTNFREFLMEDIEKVETELRRSRVRSGAVSPYVSIEGLPHDSSRCPEYYNL